MIKKDRNDQQKIDLETIKDILDGNSRSFEILEKQYRRIVASLIRRMIKDEDDVKDLTQETFIKAFSNLDKYQFNYNFSSWLFKIASNTCIDFIRKKRFPTVSISKSGNDSENEQDYEIKDESYVPDFYLMANERKKALLDAIESLPENYKEIIRLRHSEDMDYVDISKKLNLPLGTVKAHLFRARKMLYYFLKNKQHLFIE
jgi:RNA polymerase sigma-70 factor (ECF subfamily)